jgi:transposase-like protein
MEMITGAISIKKIFLCREAWLTFWINNALKIRWAILWNVAKMLMYRSDWGHKIYRCPQCNTEKKAPHTCKSRFCSSCGKAHADKWSETALTHILDVRYKHLFFTIPEEIRVWFSYNRKTMTKILFTAAKNALLKYAEKRGFKPGIIMVSHTFGGAIGWNPHVHVIITAGGLSLDHNRWLNEDIIPHRVVKPLYRYNFLTLMSKEFKNGKLKVPPEHSHIKTAQTFESYLTQFHQKAWFVGLGKTLRETDPKVKYIARYTRRPVIAESRIKSFDGETVTFEYHDKATDEKMTKTYPTQVFIKELVQHIPDPHEKIIRNCGIFANRTKAKMLEKARIALKQPRQVNSSKLTWREMIKKTFGIDPLRCPKCGSKMLYADNIIVRSADTKNALQKKHKSILEFFYHKKFAVNTNPAFT